MATTTNLELVLIETGQRDKDVTINGNMQIIDLVPTYLGEFASDPATAGVAAGSTYFNTGSSKLRFLQSDLTTWTNVA